MRRVIFIIAGALIPLLTPAVGGAGELNSLQVLGRSIFFDQHLSINQNQACAGCHSVATGFTSPDTMVNAHGAVVEGSLPGRFGDRKPPSAAYATASPILHPVTLRGSTAFFGGNFWDGRATGEQLGSPAADQAMGPFLNPKEMALPYLVCVVWRVCYPVEPDSYPVKLQDVWGPDACAIEWPSDIDALCSSEDWTGQFPSDDYDRIQATYQAIALSIAAFEDSPEVNAFSSAYDAALAGLDDLTREEVHGYALFRGKAGCQHCHPTSPARTSFTTFGYASIGTPKNPENPQYAEFPDFVDLGLGDFLWHREDWVHYASENDGKHKIPTLRNVDRRPYPAFVKAYTHNGYFKSLDRVVHFLNTRDVLEECPTDREWTDAEAELEHCWPRAEVTDPPPSTLVGDLGLTRAEEDALVAFLRTLTDGEFTE